MTTIQKANKNLSVLFRRIAREGVSLGFLFTTKIYKKDKEFFKLATKESWNQSGKSPVKNFSILLSLKPSSKGGQSAIPNQNYKYSGRHSKILSEQITSE